MVEENFEIINFLGALKCLFGMLLPSPCLKKVLIFQPLECSKIAHLLHTSKFTMVEENFVSANYVNVLKWLIWDAFTFTMVEENFDIMTS